jgi:hypothetical protein
MLVVLDPLNKLCVREWSERVFSNLEKNATTLKKQHFASFLTSES